MLPRSVRIALAASVLFVFLGAGFWLHALLFTRSSQGQSSSNPSQNSADTLQTAFVRVAERVRPAVVHVGTVQVARGRRPPVAPGPFADDPLSRTSSISSSVRGARGAARSSISRVWARASSSTSADTCSRITT